MSWAARRRVTILAGIGVLLLVGAAAVYFAGFYHAPSCFDNTQNQDEVGIDCGGSCSRLCTAAQIPPTVLFTKALRNGVGRIDIIAEVENKNLTAAAKNVSYQVTLYSIDQSLVRRITGTLDLPPGARVPIFIPNAVVGSQSIANAFLEIASSSPQWFVVSNDPRSIPDVSNVSVRGSAAAPRVEAIVSNPTTETLTNVTIIVLVHNISGDVIAASRTLVPHVPAQGSATATFTWNVPFASVPASIEVIPVIPLP